jgi:MFS family permease
VTPEHNLRWLYTGRGLRSLATAFLTVIFPLYLAADHYTAAQLGWVLTASTAVSLVLVTLVGLAADRVGRKPVLVGLAALATLGGMLMAVAPAAWVVVVASGLGGIGRGGGAGSGGSWGPVFPAEQPLVANSVPPHRRTQAFGTLSFVGVLAGAAGSLVAAIPAGLHADGWPWLAAYRALFWAGGGLGLLMVLATLPIREPERTRAYGPPPPLNVRQLVGRLGLTNALNGLGFGFLGPLLTYWFYRRFGVGPAEIGVLYTVVNLAAAFPYLASSRLAARLGAVRTVVVTRAVGLLLMVAMAFVGNFWAAGLLYMARMAFNSLGMPARQSFAMGVADERYRSRVAAFSTLPSQMTSAISPAIAGSLMDQFLDVPIVGATLFMGLNVVAYWLLFRHVRPPEESEPNIPAAPGG